MKRNTITCTMTLLAVAIASSLVPVHAATTASQPSDISQPANGTSNAQTSDAQPSNATTNSKDKKKKQEADASTLSTVVVTPLHASLGSAAEMKQDSDNIVDSIVSEDIGKMPDNSVADAMQRITGVQIAQGFQGETDTVVVRGLPNVETTLNGREIFSSTGRSFAFQDLPATAVKSVQVYKTSDASQPDGGIAGLVNMQLFRPLDFQGPEVAGTITGTNSAEAARTDGNASLLLSDRWHTDAGDFGALLNASINTQHYDYKAVWGDFPTLLETTSGTPIRSSTGSLIEVPNGFGADYNIGYRRRPEVNYALQWKPNEQTEIYAEGMMDYDYDSYNQPFFFTYPNGTATPTSYTVGNNCYADALPGAYYGQRVCDATSATWSGNSYAATSTQTHQEHGHDIQSSIGAKWHNDAWSLSTDLSETASSYTEDTLIVDTFLKGPITTVWNGTAGNQQNWSLAGNPQNNAQNYYLNGLYQTWFDERGNELAWRADGVYTFESGFFQNLQFGVRTADRTSSYIGSVQNSIAPPGGTGELSLNPNPANQVLARFPANYFCAMPGSPALAGGWLTGCYNYLVGNANAIRALYGTNQGLAPVDPGRYYNIDEKTYAAYLQSAYSATLFGLPLDGLIGARVEQVHRDLDAYSFNTATGIYTPLQLSTHAPVYLPNVSAVLHFTDTLQARFNAAKTVTYPDFGDLNPSISLNPGTVNRLGNGSSGNAYLNPIRSTNYDLSLEWYFSPGSYASAGAFYRNINGYIQSYVTNETIGGQLYQISSPQSAGSGYLQGVELAYQQFFDFLPGIWNGLGTQLNFTYIDGSTKSPEYIGGPMVTTPLQNVSKDNYNAVLMYEKYNWSVRLAYDFRSRYIDGFNAQNVASVNDEIVPANQVDLSIGYNIGTHSTVVLQMTNLLGADLHEYWGDGTTRPRDIRFQDRTVSLGFRFKL
ncbi:TonB-dependent receptor [Dyella monticola]|uniref:TonB-dependent receptor n=1 Tax=Dyella monticola TaxID=1927958 RepID=A0A370WTJ8_9GAMM|nr:TonB-dependent receptor [Dyella monticola]RDS79450.1 TonB-dependent receptor [Dyella monticola]